LKRQHEAVVLAELLNDPGRKTSAFFAIAEQIREQGGQKREWLALFLRAGQVACTITNPGHDPAFLHKLATTLVQVQQWEQARMVANAIKDNHWRDAALEQLVLALIQAQLWEQAQAVIAAIRDNDCRGRACGELAIAFDQAQ